MPYVACPGCSLRTYSAAAWADTDHCPGCGRQLPSKPLRFAAVRRGVPRNRAAQVESARTALLRLRQRPGEG
jgi:hypothetical protein